MIRRLPEVLLRIAWSWTACVLASRQGLNPRCFFLGGFMFLSNLVPDRELENHVTN